MSAETAAENSPPLAWRGTVGWAWTVFGPFLGLVLIAGLFAWITRDSGTFLTAYTWRTIAFQTVVVGIAALGMTAVIIAGGIDLSVGSAVALVTVVVALATTGFNASALGRTLRVPPMPLGVAMLAGLLTGGLCGLFNGGLITRLGVVPFIVTLGSLKIFRGAATWLGGSGQVYMPDDAKPAWLGRILVAEPSPSWLFLAPGVWIMLGLGLLLALVLRYSVLGRYIYAVGSSEPTARLCGIDVPATKLAVYGLAGLATGLAGVLQFISMNGEGDPTTANGLELQVIAAVVIGGGSLSGGEGTVLGTLIGCLIMSVLDSGCIHAGIRPASRDVIIGAIIIAAVTLDRFRRRGA